METDTAPKPKRRWFQYSLRTLLIGVALLAIPCAYVGHEVRIVAERKAWLSQHPQEMVSGVGLFSEPDPSSLPVIRRLLGDRVHRYLFVEPADEQRAKELFPEAERFFRDGDALEGPSPKH